MAKEWPKRCGCITQSNYNGHRQVCQRPPKGIERRATKRNIKTDSAVCQETGRNIGESLAVFGLCIACV